MTTQRLARIPRHILVGAVAALITAALHLTFVTFEREVLGQFSWGWFSRDVIWMVPAGYLVVYTLVSIPLGILAAVLPRGISARATTWVWASIITFSILLLFPRIHSVAWLVVAVAAGYQLSRVAARNPHAVTRMTARAGVALATAFAVLIATFEGRRALQERRAVNARPNAAQDSPNVILIVWDTARAKSFSYLGYGRRTTPFLDSLARQAVVFDRAFATAPWTLPSHASMLTGRYGTQQSGDWLSPLDGTHPTLAEVLHARGYATGAFVANWLATGYSSGLHRGFERYEDTKRTWGEVVLNTTLTQSTAILTAYRYLVRDRWLGEAARALLAFDWRPYDSYQSHAWKSGAEVTDEFLTWQRDLDAPFFAFLNYPEAHNPHRAPGRHRFDGGKTFTDLYDAALYSLDAELRRLANELQRRGELSNTIIVVTSDHGEQIGDHGLQGHGNSLYLTLLHVPLVIYAPNHPAAGSRFSRVVSLRDLPRTLVDLAGISDSKIPGAALLPHSGEAWDVTPSPAISEVSSGLNDNPRNPTYYGDLTSVVDDSLHVIRDGRGKHHVYAYKKDPEEAHDLAQDPSVEAWARAKIDSVLHAFELRAPNARGQRDPER